MEQTNLPLCVPSYDTQREAESLCLVERRFAVIDETLRDMIQFKVPKALILSGAPGFGKTHKVRTVFAEFGLPWEPVRPSAKALIDVLYERERNKERAPLVFDDYDTAFKTPALMEIFKILLDSHSLRILSNQVKGGNVIPKFEVTAACVFISNRDLDNREHFSQSVWLSDIPALKNRSAVMSLPYNEMALNEYTLKIAPRVLDAVKFRDARGYDRFLSKLKRQEIIDHYIANAEKYKERSPRTIQLLGELRLVTPDDAAWHRKRTGQFLIEEERL